MALVGPTRRKLLLINMKEGACDFRTERSESVHQWWFVNMGRQVYPYHHCSYALTRYARYLRQQWGEGGLFLSQEGPLPTAGADTLQAPVVLATVGPSRTPGWT